jgi:hypothetical protein
MSLKLTEAALVKSISWEIEEAAMAYGLVQVRMIW